MPLAAGRLPRKGRTALPGDDVDGAPRGPHRGLVDRRSASEEGPPRMLRR